MGGREKVRWGEIETAWGCDIKISSSWWMSTRATLERTTKRLLCNGWQVISRFVWGVPLCAAVRSAAFWNFPVHYCVVCSAPVYCLQGNESWCRSVTEEDCAFCPVWKNVASFIEASLIHLKHIYMTVKIELLPGYNMLDHVLPSVISRRLIVSASWLMGQNR